MSLTPYHAGRILRASMLAFPKQLHTDGVSEGPITTTEVKVAELTFGPYPVNTEVSVYGWVSADGTVASDTLGIVIRDDSAGGTAIGRALAGNGGTNWDSVGCATSIQFLLANATKTIAIYAYRYGGSGTFTTSGAFCGLLGTVVPVPT